MIDVRANLVLIGREVRTIVPKAVLQTGRNQAYARALFKKYRADGAQSPREYTEDDIRPHLTLSDRI